MLDLSGFQDNEQFNFWVGDFTRNVDSHVTGLNDVIPARPRAANRKVLAFDPAGYGGGRNRNVRQFHAG
jgi:hypothetical protein